MRINSSLIKGIFKSLSNNNVDIGKYDFIDASELFSPRKNSDQFVDAALLFRLISEIRKNHPELESFYRLFSHMHVLDLGLLGHYLLSCKNIFTAYERMLEYQLLFSNFIEFKYKRQNERILWSVQMPYQIFNERYNVESLSDFELFFRLKIIETLSTTTLFPQHIELFYTKDNSRERLHFFASTFGCNVAFTKRSNVLHFNAADLNRDIHYKNFTIYKNMPALLTAQIHELYKNKTYKNTIISIVLNNKELLPVSIEFVARKLHVSVRKLQHILKQEGTSFSRIIGEVKTILAIEYLNRGIKMKEIASKLGFNEAGSFSRQFKQLTGINPTEYLELSPSDKSGILNRLSN